MRPRTAIVITRDRVTYARRCVAALLETGLDVHLVDHGSTYPEMLRWLEWVEGTSPGHVHLRGDHHPRDLWTWDELPRVTGSAPYVVTDPDVIPDESCPTNWPIVLGRLVERYPHCAKIGLGLRLDDLPKHYEHAERASRWEGRFHRVLPFEVDTGEGHVWVFNAPVDTTLACYRPGTSFALTPALRTGAPYLARHLTWYENSTDLPPDVMWYRRHLPPGTSHWADPETYERS